MFGLLITLKMQRLYRLGLLFHAAVTSCPCLSRLLHHVGTFKPPASSQTSERLAFIFIIFSLVIPFHVLRFSNVCQDLKQKCSKLCLRFHGHRAGSRNETCSSNHPPLRTLSFHNQMALLY